jgi:argininosuccinate lyase
MDLTLAEFKQFSPLFEADIMDAIKVETCVAARNSFGGTSYEQVAQAVGTAGDIILQQQTVLDMYTKNNI